MEYSIILLGHFEGSQVMKEKIQAKLQELIEVYCRETGIQNLWREPIIKYGDVKSPHFDELKELVDSNHYHPLDYLTSATVVLSYFLPFSKSVMESNISGELISEPWALAYEHSNKMASYINDQLCKYINELGYDACPPRDAGMINDGYPRSCWSQRHVAYVCGHGTFGLNNMLISDKGCVGRYYSIITALPIEPDDVVTEERCIYKRNGGCKLCVDRCVANALTVDGFERLKCLDQCNVNEEIYPAAGACGKCVVGLPCSFK